MIISVIRYLNPVERKVASLTHECLQTCRINQSVDMTPFLKATQVRNQTFIVWKVHQSVITPEASNSTCTAEHGGGSMMTWGCCEDGSMNHQFEALFSVKEATSPLNGSTETKYRPWSGLVKVWT